MPHACPLGFEIASIVDVRLDDDRYILYYFQPIAFQPYTFYRVVGDEAYLAYAEVAQYLRAHTILAFIRLEAEVYISIDSVITLLLELVRTNLVHQTNSATFLLQIYDSTAALLLYHSHGLMELLSTVATLRAEYVASHAT